MLSVERDPSVKITRQSKPNRNYLVFVLWHLEDWLEITDNHPSEGDHTAFTDSDLPDGATSLYYRVVEVEWRKGYYRVACSLWRDR